MKNLEIKIEVDGNEYVFKIPGLKKFQKKMMMKCFLVQFVLLNN